MDNDTKNFIAACKASIAKHEAALLDAIDRNDHTTIGRLNLYRAGLLARIAEAKAEASARKVAA